MANITIIGLWHQGVVLSACLADLGHTIIGFDEDEDLIAELNAANPPVFEPNLKEELAQHIQSGTLTFVSEWEAAIDEADFVFVSYDTPIGPDGDPQVELILDAVERLAGTKGDFVVVVTSQIPVGTSRRLGQTLKVPLAHVPEFLQLGTALETFRNADRFVIGAEHEEVSKRVAQLFEPLGRPLVLCDLASAEMAKHSSNAFLAVSISFINEIADMCDRVGADVLDVVQSMKLDSRIGPRAYLDPGLGFAGGTLARDLKALQSVGADREVSTHLIDAALTVNEARPSLVETYLERSLGTVKGKRITLFGIAYKPGTNTLRGSIAVEIAGSLASKGAEITAFDPLVHEEIPDVRVVNDPLEAAREADAVVLITQSQEVTDLDPSRLLGSMRGTVFVDTRNCFDALRMREIGFDYLGIGRGHQ